MIGAATPLTGSLALAALAALAAANPARRAEALTRPEAPHPGRRRLASAAGLTATLLGALALGARGVLDALDVGEPTARVAAGLVLTLASLVAAAGPGPAAVRGAAERGAVLVPLTFPHLLRPELALVALSAGADHGAVAVVLLAVALGVTVPADALGARARDVGGAAQPAADGTRGGEVPAARGRDVLDGLGRLLGAVGVLAGVDLVVDGVVAL